MGTMSGFAQAPETSQKTSTPGIFDIGSQANMGVTGGIGLGSGTSAGSHSFTSISFL